MEPRAHHVLIGLFTVLGWIVGLVRSALDDSGLRKAYRDRLYGMVMLDPVAGALEALLF